jgi:glutamate dehydrogenase (NAD(P)+)
MKFEVRKLAVASDEFGPESVFEVWSPSRDLVIGWVVIDNTTRSPSGTGKGGTAMYADCDLDITLKKSRVMTWKQVFCTPLNTTSRYKPWGGAKGGIRWDSSAPDAKEVLRAWARALFEHGVIPHKYVFGLDVGLKEWATREVVEELGDRKVSTGKPTDLGGIPYDELGITGYGLVLAMGQIGKQRGMDLSNPNTTIAIQGFGAVGRGVSKWIEKLHPNGAKLVMVSDKHGCLACENGLSGSAYQTLLSNPIDSAQLPKNVKLLPLGSELFASVDYLVLAHKEDQITAKNMDQIRAKAVIQGANLGVSREAEGFLWKKGILSLPDFTINCGASAVVYVEHADGSIQDGLDYVKEVLNSNVTYLLNELKTSTQPPRVLAEEIAKREVTAAMTSGLKS